MSHLPAQDLLTVKLVSRRFYTLVTSPTAWSNAFAKFFPGQESLRTTADATSLRATVHSEVRSFTRLGASTSWSSEYLARTRLLRCLMRGRPSLPFAAPCPGKPGKGSATFTFSSRIWRGCTTLDADFGSIFDKRKPQFMHGSALSGAVTSSDRRGKFDAWGFSNPVFFRHFHEIHPGYEPYGLGTGNFVGRPNVMEVSHLHGMVYAECTPGGNCHFLPVGEKHARVLTAFTGLSNPSIGIPSISGDFTSPCALWIARTGALPRMSDGVLGILTGSSNGVLTAYSTGHQGKRRYERGEMTARWVLCPGVPIIAVNADDHYNEERERSGRLLIVVLNALGEVFYLTHLPELSDGPHAPRNATPEESAQAEELRAWKTAASAQWQLVLSTKRQERLDASSIDEQDEWYGPHVLASSSQVSVENVTRKNQNTLPLTPIELRSQFNGWDMRRRLLVDFASDDVKGAGEAIVVVEPGSEDGGDSIMRHQRSVSTDLAGIKSEDRWLRTQYLFGRHKSVKVTATAIDHSILAVTTSEEDSRLRLARRATRHRTNPHAETNQEAEQTQLIPGRRARLFAVGTSAGYIFCWNIRASNSKTVDLVNDAQPVRVIATESPGIASIALSSLYIVHGGTEGLLQAWDLLASTTESIRTLSSRRLVNNRRRAVLAAQQASVPPTWATQNPDRLAATAICLDPDPTVLRGVATIDSFVKYWSYSSASAAEDLTRAQKRKMKRGNGSKNPGLGAGRESEMAWAAGSGNEVRLNLKGYVKHELHLHNLDERDRLRETKADRRFAGRFGTDLLGADATEEELLAYAKLLSEEDNEKRLRASAEASVQLSHNPSTDELEAHRAALSEVDAEKWKFASWRERYEMLNEGGVAVQPHLGESQSQVATPTAEDTELKRALELSLEEEPQKRGESPPFVMHDSESAMAGSSNAAISIKDLENDPDLAEAIALSLSQGSATPSEISPTSPRQQRQPSRRESEAEDVARAIRLSLADQGSGSSPVPDTPSSSYKDEADFPSLPSSSPPTGRGSGRGKGKERKGQW